jgi:N-methylhydantoinase A
MRYVGQGHEVECEVPLGALSTASKAAITAGFEAAYRTLYRRTPLGVAIEALNWRVVVSGPVPELTMSTGADGAASASVPMTKGTRRAYFPEAQGFVDTPVYDRYALRPGASLEGPAIIEERESTTVVGPGAHIRVDQALSLVLEPA